jgi:hypothetical protein
MKKAIEDRQSIPVSVPWVRHPEIPHPMWPGDVKFVEWRRKGHPLSVTHAMKRERRMTRPKEDYIWVTEHSLWRITHRKTGKLILPCVSHDKALIDRHLGYRRPKAEFLCLLLEDAFDWTKITDEDSMNRYRKPAMEVIAWVMQANYLREKMLRAMRVGEDAGLTWKL